jgi:nitrile hydratase accessory protein
MLICGSRILNQLDEHREILELAQQTLPIREGHEPQFQAPWQARVFALMVSMVNNHHFPWKNFQERLAAAIKRQEETDRPQTGQEISQQYFDCWLMASQETLLSEGFLTLDNIAAQIEVIKSKASEIRENQTAVNLDVIQAQSRS